MIISYNPNAKAEVAVAPGSLAGWMFMCRGIKFPGATYYVPLSEKAIEVKKE